MSSGDPFMTLVELAMTETNKEKREKLDKAMQLTQLAQMHIKCSESHKILDFRKTAAVKVVYTATEVGGEKTVSDCFFLGPYCSGADIITRVKKNGCDQAVLLKQAQLRVHRSVRSSTKVVYHELLDNQELLKGIKV